MRQVWREIVAKRDKHRYLFSTILYDGGSACFPKPRNIFERSRLTSSIPTIFRFWKFGIDKRAKVNLIKGSRSTRNREFCKVSYYSFLFSLAINVAVGKFVNFEFKLPHFFKSFLHTERIQLLIPFLFFPFCNLISRRNKSPWNSIIPHTVIRERGLILPDVRPNFNFDRTSLLPSYLFIRY